MHVVGTADFFFVQINIAQGIDAFKHQIQTVRRCHLFRYEKLLPVFKVVFHELCCRQFIFPKIRVRHKPFVKQRAVHGAGHLRFYLFFRDVIHIFSQHL